MKHVTFDIKHLIFYILTFSFIITFTSAYSYAAPNATSSATIEPTNTLIDKLKKIESLKEKIATKVAQIRENEKAAYFGKIKKIDKSNIIIEQNVLEKSFPVSEDTIFYNFTPEGKKESTFSKLSHDEYISVFGYLDDSKTVFSAKYVFTEKPLLHLIGKILDIDKNNYTITIKSPEGNTTADIETYSKINLFIPDKGLQKAGFSKMKSGGIIHITGTYNLKEANRITALRIIIINHFNRSSPTLTPSPTDTPTPASIKPSRISPTPKRASTP